MSPKIRHAGSGLKTRLHSLLRSLPAMVKDQGVTTAVLCGVRGSISRIKRFLSWPKVGLDYFRKGPKCVAAFRVERPRSEALRSLPVWVGIVGTYLYDGIVDVTSNNKAC